MPGASPGPATNSVSEILTHERFMLIFPRDGISVGGLYRWRCIVDACDRYSITDPEHLAAALAQWSHETGGLRWLSEIWGPTKQQEKYEPPHALARQLGNTQPGDGQRFRGRGLPMLTGRANYADAGREFDLALQREPDQVALFPLAALVGAWFFRSHNLMGLDFEAQTRRLNGGLTGLPDRLKRWAEVRRVLGLA